MSWTCKVCVLGKTLMAMAGMIAWTVPADAQNVTSGTITAVYGDPGDFVVELSQAGSCGSRFFHIQRANPNFKEMVAVSLTAFAASKTMGFFVTSCSGDRNITSHGFALRS